MPKQKEGFKVQTSEEKLFVRYIFEIKSLIKNWQHPYSGYHKSKLGSDLVVTLT